jgi:rhodanese-related sulfurtransferase
MIRLLFTFLCVSTFFLACKSNKSEDWRSVKDMIRRQYPYVSTLTTDALHTWINDTNRIAPMLIDTRSRPEFDISHLNGAIYAETRADIDAVTANTARNQEIVVYCSVGFRSAKMANWLNSRGFKNVHNLEGSIFEWANKGYSIYRKGTLVNTVHPYDEDWGRLLDKNLWKTEPE